ncbi:PSD1 and planctomycete cytochrome C domain-containing protein [Stieleria sp. ICT_E10.1]|uniref:PSD1 and planctomycete cytochrome C domain-containing protein n=1 Tax=Stieleria sedimenti TaxID=2976331 RepID=UPI0021806E72|nr:PSD1 and planctomycete cytochrome C domain-containing protein [Stieleria sedimenti]MCS7467679.1 PSD1 and planctomycete cytochrome C domain-containing protein [Stieleria sedimenti]
MRRSAFQFATAVSNTDLVGLLRRFPAACLVLLFAMASDVTAAPPIFEDVAQTVLAKKCGKCHSADVQKGELDLSSMTGVRRGGESGDPLLADSIDESRLWSVIADGEMPPDGEPPLDATERKSIHTWIEAGGHSNVVAESHSETVDTHDILPIVLLRCNACHGPRIRQAGVDLRSRAAMIAGGKNGPAMIPGDADASPMIRRIESHACPPSESLLKFFVRRPTKAEVQTLRQWIDAGAPPAGATQASDSESSSRAVADEDRQHWSFQPPVATTRFHSIDAFILDRLAENDLELAPTADRDTLIRRAHIDLIGLPPSPDEYRVWHDSDDANWYAQMIDRLLASNHYGERWGRYWLDLAGYADSEGGISADPIRKVAWKYRDYVIRAFNDDKPYDQFLLEQLAGDELVDYQNADTITDAIVDQLIATGFLRMGIDETGSRTMNFVPERLKVISDAITVVSEGLMGLTMECARCHSHKYDPIPHRDYYRLKAVFQGALDEHDWDSFKTRTLNVATPEHRRKVAEKNPPLEKQIKQLQGRQKQWTADLQLQLLRDHYPDQSEDDNRATLNALKKADNNRTLKQKILVERLVKAELRPDSQQSELVLSLRQQIEDADHQIDRVRRKMAPSLAIRALWDLGRPSPTYVLRRGEHDKPGDPVAAGVPAVLTDQRNPFVVTPPFPDGTAKTGRRLALARWLTDPNHPLTARVMVNRIWHHHFGTGLVKDLENFGVQGERPSHPELLDWLAIEFIERGWSIKEMHRLIMNSRVYQQSSRVSERAHQVDPQNRLLSHMNLRRMDAEALRDSLLAIAGRLDTTPGGLPDTVSIDRDGLVSANATEGGDWRRSVYLQYRRTEIPTMMDTFDYPQMGPNCLSRNVSTVSPQALMLMNNGRVRKLAAAMADRVETIVCNEARHDEDSLDETTVETVYQLALSRSPSDRERTLGTEALQQLRSAWGNNPGKALETYCHTILNSASFLYVD